MKIRLPKTVRNILLTALVMIMLFVVGGLIYVLLADRSAAKPPASSAASQSTSEPDVIKPVPPTANAPEGVAIETLVSPVKAGDNSSATVRTNAGSGCTISVSYNGAASKDSGLAPKAADVYGFATWTWTVEPGVPAGTWPVQVTCVYHGRTGTVTGNLQVTK